MIQIGLNLVSIHSYFPHSVTNACIGLLRLLNRFSKYITLAPYIIFACLHWPAIGPRGQDLLSVSMKHSCRVRIHAHFDSFSEIWEVVVGVDLSRGEVCRGGLL